MRDLKISDGTTTETLHAATYPHILRYTPQAPNVETVTFTTGEDGAEQPRARYTNVTDKIQILYASFAAARTSIATLQRLFDSARMRQTRGLGAPVYVQYRPDGAETLYRSEVLSGRVTLTDELWRQVEITINRRYFWESTTETQLNLYNPSVASTSNVTIYNYDRTADAKHNHVHIAAGSILGDISSPARLELLNNYASGVRTTHIWAGHYLTEATLFTPTLEAESGTISASGGAVANANASAGNYANLWVTGTSEYLAWYTSITNAQLIAAGGNWFKIVAVPFGLPTAANVYLRARISIDGITTLFEGLPRLVNNITGDRLPIDLGTVQLPNNVIGLTNPYPLRLTLLTRNAAGGTATIPIDYVFLMPAYGFRNYQDIGFSMAQNVTLHDKPLDNMLYTDGWANGQSAHYIALGDPIMLRPNRVNGLYFQMTPTDSKLRSLNVKVFYRQRKLIV